MIRLSRKCEYALRALFELAMRGDGHPVKIHRIATAQSLPPRFLEVILNELRHAGLVQSRRGNAGGYTLARPAKQLSVGEVIEQIQGPIELSGQHHRGSKYYYGDYAFARLWKQISRAVSGMCNSTSFAELVECEKKEMAKRVLDYTI